MKPPNPEVGYTALTPAEAFQVHNLLGTDALRNGYLIDTLNLACLEWAQGVLGPEESARWHNTDGGGQQLINQATTEFWYSDNEAIHVYFDAKALGLIHELASKMVSEAQLSDDVAVMRPEVFERTWHITVATARFRGIHEQ